jgi:hypothetical protein
VTDKDGGHGSATLQMTMLPSFVLLDPTASGALSLSGNANISIPGGVVVDSSSSQAISLSGNAKLTSSSIQVHGNIRFTGNANVVGTVTTGVNLPNPLANLSYSPTIPASPPSVSISSGSQTLQPGTYASISVSGSGSLTLSPSIYVLAGGGMSVTGTGTLSGQGVAIYNTRNTGGAYGSINLAGNGAVSLTPRASGLTLAGILIFQDTPVSFVASTGDFGTADPEYPAFSPNVVAIGGTSLYLNADGTYNSEVGWGYYSSAVGGFIASGGGLSQFEPQPAYQAGVQSTGYRTTPDVSLVADPNTGAWIADPYNLPADNPFEVVGGTRLSAPAWAGLIAIVNQGRAAAGLPTLSSNGGTTIQSASTAPRPAASTRSCRARTARTMRRPATTW